MSVRLWLKVEATPGSDIREAIRAAIDFSRNWGVGVVLPCNRVDLLIVGTDSVEEVHGQYCRRVKILHGEGSGS